MNNGPIRELTQDERGKWGSCRVCLVRHGEPCVECLDRAGLGNSDRFLMSDGVHVQRMRNAPFRVREVPA